MERTTTVDEVNELLLTASKEDLDGILGFEERPLVSVDFKGDPRSGIVDGTSTRVINGSQVKILAFYDNEWGYANRMVDICEMVSQRGAVTAG